jgi:hypothetical protein
MTDKTSQYSWLGPIVLDGDGNGVTLVSVVNSTVLFDMDGDGIRDQTGWVGPNDAILVYDANGNNIADNGAEIGFQNLVGGAASDLEGLVFFDTNKNGALDAGDADFGKFLLWNDTNQNGISEASELTSLSEAEVSSIALTGKRTGQTPNGKDNTLFADAEYTLANGTKGKVGDVFLAFEPGKPTGTGGGGTTPPVTDPPVPTPPGLVIASHDFDRKAKKYLIESKDGAFYIHPKRAKDIMDPRAGQVGAAIIMKFKNVWVGMISPIVLDLNGDGLNLVRLKKTPVRFDMDGDGTADRTGWVGKSEGILVLDRNDDGKITAASELSFLTEKADAKNGFDALGSLDSNRDGSNGSGTTDEGELKTLADLGIVEIGLASRANNQMDKVGENLVLSTSYFKRSDGTTGTVGDVALAFDPTSAFPRPVAPTLPVDDSLPLAQRQMREIRAALGGETLAKSQLSLGEAIAASNNPAVDPVVVQMTQAMASFGASSGAALLLPNASIQPQYPFFA